MLYPFRLIAAIYVDVLRGIPLLILLYLVGFGVPALGFSFLPTDYTVLGGVALALCYSAYVSEVFRAGIESIHPCQPAAAFALGLTRTQTLRYVVVPQAVRRVAPPLLNDFIGLTKDVALVSILGPQEIVRVAQINTDVQLQLHAVHRGGRDLPADHAAADPRRRLPAPARAAPAERRGDDVSATPVLALRGVTKFYGERCVLAGIDLDVTEGEAVALIGASGSGKSTLLRCIDLLEEIDDGDIYLDGVADHRSGHRPDPDPPPPRPRLPGLQPLPPHAR